MVRHAGTGAVCVVDVTYTDSDLVIQVTDDGGADAGTVPAGTVSARTGLEGLAAAGAGHGIIGMRERVNLCGGSFRAGPRAAGGFQVLAALPLPVTGYLAGGAGGAGGGLTGTGLAEAESAAESARADSGATGVAETLSVQDVVPTGRHGGTG